MLTKKKMKILVVKKYKKPQPRKIYKNKKKRHIFYKTPSKIPDSH